MAEKLGTAYDKFAEKAASGVNATYDPTKNAGKGWIKKYSNKLVKGIDDTTREALRQQMAEGWLAGESANQMAKRIRQVMADASRYRSFMIGRTEASFVGNMATMAEWQRAGVGGKKWHTAQDERVCPVCGPMHNFEMPLDEAFPGWFHSGVQIGDTMVPPLHPNCLPGDALVLARSRIAGCSKRWFDGDVVIVRTTAGLELTSTPNHPILTPTGWVAASRLNIGDHVICDGGGEWRGRGDRDDQDVPSRIEDIAEALIHSGEMATRPVPVTAEHFHGDGAGSKVAIIGTDRHLMGDQQPSVRQHPSQGDIQMRDVQLTALHGQGMSAFPLEGGRAAANCPVCGADLSRPLLGRHPKPLDRLGLALGPERDAAFSKAAMDDLATDAELARQIVHGATGEVFPDQVIDIEIVAFHGFVYNLQTAAGFFTANGIITHNCRCTMLATQLEDMHIEFEPVLQAKSGIPSNLTYSKDGGYLGGAGEKHILVDAQGNEYIAKPAYKKYSTEPEPFRAHVQQAAAKVHSWVDPDNFIEVRTMTLKIKGKDVVSTVQPLLKGVEGDLKGTPVHGLTTAQRKAVQREHVTDWLVANFDGHGGNLIKLADGRILGVDKEQAFRYIDKPGAKKMSTEFHPNAQYGEKEPIYNTLYRGFAKKEIDLDLQTVLPHIARIEKISAKEYRENFRPYAESLKGKGTAAEDLLDTILARKGSLREDYRTFYSDLLTERYGKPTKCVFADEPGYGAAIAASVKAKAPYAPPVTASPAPAAPTIKPPTPKSAQTTATQNAATHLSATELKTMTISSLKSIAKEAKIPYFLNMNKTELVTALAYPEKASQMSQQVRDRLNAAKLKREGKATEEPKYKVALADDATVNRLYRQTGTWMDVTPAQGEIAGALGGYELGNSRLAIAHTKDGRLAGAVRWTEDATTLYVRNLGSLAAGSGSEMMEFLARQAQKAGKGIYVQVPDASVGGFFERIGMWKHDMGASFDGRCWIVRSNEVPQFIKGLEARRAVTAKPVPNAVPPKPTGHTIDLFDDLSLVAKTPYGQGVRKDAHLVEGQQITVRRIEAEGKDGYQVFFKVPEASHQAVVAGLRGKGVRELDPQYFNRGRIDAQTGKYIMTDSIGANQGQAHVWKGRGIEVRFSNDKDVYATFGLLDVRVLGAKSGAEAAQKLKAVLKDLGLDGATLPPTPDADRKMRLARLIWQDAPKVAYDHRLQMPGMPLKELEALAKASKVDLKRLNKVVDQEVYPGYITQVEQGRSQAYKKAGAEYLWAGAGHESNRVADLFKTESPGLMSGLQRTLNGVFGRGASSSSDFGTGGADSVFLRIATKSGKGHDYGDHFSGGGYQVIVGTKEMNRLDWFAHESDQYGRTGGSDFANRKPALEHVKSLQREYRSGNEIMFRRGIAKENIIAVHCRDNYSKKALVDEFKSRGIYRINGVAIEDFVKVRSSITSDY